MSDALDGLDAVLEQHTGWGTPNENRMGTRRRWFCNCGEKLDDNYSGVDILRRHRAHVADAIRAHLSSLGYPDVD